MFLHLLVRQVRSPMRLSNSGESRGVAPLGVVPVVSYSLIISSKLTGNMRDNCGKVAG